MPLGGMLEAPLNGRYQFPEPLFSMVNRRQVLVGLAALAVSQAACDRRTTNAFRVMALRGVLPPQLINDVTAVVSKRLRITTQRDWVRLIQKLQIWHQPAIASDTATPGDLADWVCITDYWLFTAIQQELIRPLSGVDRLPGWSDLAPVWSSVLRRGQAGLPADMGSLWGTPYRWGSLAIVYDQRPFDRLGWQPTTWQDLLRPELRGKIALPNHPRLVLGLLLKALGYSANDPNPAAHADFLEALEALRPQVRVYSTEHYLQSLVVNDIWLAVGWSTEIQPLLPQYRQLQAIAPDPATLLSADIWVKPNAATIEQESPVSLTEVDETWLAYWWQPKTAAPLNLFSQGLSPLMLLPQRIDDGFAYPDGAIVPTAAQIQASEFIVPLPEAAIDRYNTLWQQLRGSE